jgi:hypothetical protein
MNPLFLITKGIKAKKKRLAGGGGGGGISAGTKLIGDTSKQGPISNHSHLRLHIEDTTNGQFYADPISGSLIIGNRVSDFVAIANSVVGVSTVLTNGTATLSAGNAYEIAPEAYYSGHSSVNPTGTEQLTVSVIQDTANNVSNGHIGINGINIAGGVTFNLTQPYRSAFNIGRIEISPSASAGTLIFKLHIAGGTTDTDANVLAGNAATSDSYYLRVILS